MRAQKDRYLCVTGEPCGRLAVTPNGGPARVKQKRD
jgi:ribosomal protein S27E